MGYRILLAGSNDPDLSLVNTYLNETNAYQSSVLTHMTSEPSGTHPETDAVILDLASDIKTWSKQIQMFRVLNNTPIIGLLPIVDADNFDQIRELDLAAWVFKPFVLEELHCRLALVIKQSENTASQQLTAHTNERRRNERRKVIDRNYLVEKRHGDRRCQFRPFTSHKTLPFRVDNATKRIYLDNKMLPLTPKEYELLACFITSNGAVLSPDDIIKQVWPDSKNASNTDVQQYIHRLRRKIEKDPSEPQWLLNAKGFGYYWRDEKPAQLP